MLEMLNFAIQLSIVPFVILVFIIIVVASIIKKRRATQVDTNVIQEAQARSSQSVKKIAAPLTILFLILTLVFGYMANSASQDSGGAWFGPGLGSFVLTLVFGGLTFFSFLTLIFSYIFKLAISSQQEVVVPTVAITKVSRRNFLLFVLFLVIIYAFMVFRRIHN